MLNIYMFSLLVFNLSVINSSCNFFNKILSYFDKDKNNSNTKYANI